MAFIFNAVAKKISALTGLSVAERYSFESTIGKGKFSQVKRAVDRETGRVVAIKIMLLPTLDQQVMGQELQLDRR